MKTIIKTGIAALAGALLSAACTDLSSIDNKLDSLDSRVSALEKAVDAVNSNITALRTLAGNQTINSVEQDGDTWKLTLGNGTVITLYQGTIGTGNTPVLSIDSEGYWQVDYGAGPEPVLQGGGKVSALGADGVTPQFGVDDDNCWIVSYDGGATWQSVLYSTGEHAGEKVKAYDSGSGDSYFHNVEYRADDGVFVLTMKSGQAFRVPVVSDFLCSIEGVDEVQKFDYGQTRTFTVTMKGVSDYTLIVPDGWTASLQGEGDCILAVTAPAGTKSVYADSSQDVSILAFTQAGLSTAAKMQVGLTGQTWSQSPYTSPSRLDVGPNEARVRVLVENADEWYYLLSTDATAPHAVEIIADGVKGSASIFTLTGLKQLTTYYLYTVALKGTDVSVVSYCSFRTGLTDDRYQAYLDGEDMVIADMHFSKNTHGTAKLLVATQENDGQLISAVAGGGVIFLETPDGTSFRLDETKLPAETIIIGRYASNRARVNQSAAGRLRPGASLAMCYLDYDGTARKDASDKVSIMVQADAFVQIPFMVFDSCTIKAVSGAAFVRAGVISSGTVTSDANVDVFRMVSCDVRIVEHTGYVSMHFYNTAAWQSIARIKEITYRDNIFYSPGDLRMSLHFPSAGFTAGTEYAGYADTVVDVSNNTFYGTGTDWYAIRTYSCGSITVKRNLCWQYTGATVGAFNFVDPYYQHGGAPVYDVQGNLSYGASFRAVGSTSITDFPADNVASASLTNPLPGVNPDTWNFTPAAGFDKYGAQR